MTRSSDYYIYASTIMAADYDGMTDVYEVRNGLTSERITTTTSSSVELYNGDTSISIRPVINISGDAYIYNGGNGTAEEPYLIR